MKQKLIPFYVNAHQNQMGHSLFIDIQTKDIYRIYNDNYRIFSSVRYWIYFYAAYWAIKTLTDFTFTMSAFTSILLLILLGGGVFVYTYTAFYKIVLKQSNKKPVYLTNDEFINYVNEGRKNTWMLILIFSIMTILLVLSIFVYIAFPSIDLLIIILLLLFVVSALCRSLPLTRLRLQYQKKYLKTIANAVHQKMIKG